MPTMNIFKRFHPRSSIDTTNTSQQQKAQVQPQDKASTTGQMRTQHRNHPTVIEVFQSQGCNSCPPTNSLLLSKMAQKDPNILILDYHVTYWDYLGWKDPFGVREADTYQREYANARGTSRVYTPQVIINGTVEGVGNSEGTLQKLIEDGERKASQRSARLSFSETEEGVSIIESSSTPSSEKRQGRVIEVIYDPAPHDVHIPRGENSGRTLTQRNTVRIVKEVGLWADGQGPIKLAREDPSDGLPRVLLVQEVLGGAIIGVYHTSI